jgi:hypothetical protein
MQAIFEYVSTGDLWGLAGIAAVTAILAANCNYQKHRALACDRIAPRTAQTAPQAKQPAGRIAAHA